MSTNSLTQCFENINGVCQLANDQLRCVKRKAGKLLFIIVAWTQINTHRTGVAVGCLLGLKLGEAWLEVYDVNKCNNSSYRGCFPNERRCQSS